MKRLFALMLTLGTSLTAVAADDRAALLAVPQDVQTVLNGIAEFDAVAEIFKPQRMILIQGSLTGPGPFTGPEPAILHLWLVLPDRVVELKPNTFGNDETSFAFNASFEGLAPGGSTYVVVAEFKLPGGTVLRLRTAPQCLSGASFMARLEPGETECKHRFAEPD